MEQVRIYISISLSSFGTILRYIRKQIPGALEKVVSKEKTPEGVLDSPTHLYQVSQNVSSGLFIGLDVHHTNCHQEIAVVQI